jgi:hypothetical protein
MHRRPQVRAEAPYQFDWRALVRTALTVVVFGAVVVAFGASFALVTGALALPAALLIYFSALTLGSLGSLGSRTLARLDHSKLCRCRYGRPHKAGCLNQPASERRSPRVGAIIPDDHPIDAYEATLGWLRSKLLSDELSGEVYALCVDSLEQVHEALRGAARQRLTSAYSRPANRLTVLPAGTRITPVTCSRCRDGLLRQGDSFQCCVCGRGQARRDLAGVADLLESMR